MKVQFLKIENLSCYIFDQKIDLEKSSKIQQGGSQPKSFHRQTLRNMCIVGSIAKEAGIYM